MSIQSKSRKRLHGLFLAAATAAPALMGQPAVAGSFSFTVNQPFEGIGSSHFASPDTGFFSVETRPFGPQLRLDYTQSDSWLEPFLSLRARAYKARVQPDIAETYRHINRYIKDIPELPRIVHGYLIKAGVPRVYADAFIQGELRLGDIRARDRDALSKGLARFLNVPEGETIIRSIIDGLPQDTILRPQSLAETAHELETKAREMAEILKSLPGAQARKEARRLERIADGFARASSVLSDVDETITDINAFDIHDYARGYAFDHFNYGLGQDDILVTEGGVIAGLRVRFFDTGRFALSGELAGGVLAQYWPTTLGGPNGVCIKPHAEADLLATYQLTQGIQVGARAGVATNAPCIFVDNSVIYSLDNLWSASAGIFATYRFGQNAFAPVPNGVQARKTEPTDIRISAFASCTPGTAQTILFFGVNGFRLLDMAESAVSYGGRLEKKDRIAGAWNLFTTMGVQGRFGQASGILGADQKRALALANRFALSGQDISALLGQLTNLDLELLGLTPERIAKITNAQLRKYILDANNMRPLHMNGYTGDIMAIGKFGTDIKLDDNLTLSPYLTAGIGMKGTWLNAGNYNLVNIAPTAMAGVGLDLGYSWRNVTASIVGELAMQGTAPGFFLDSNGDMSVGGKFKARPAVQIGAQLNIRFP